MDCIEIKGLGFTYTAGLHEWCHNEIQDEELAALIAHRMIAGDDPYKYNEDHEHMFYREFSILDRNEFVKQYGLLKWDELAGTLGATYE